MSALSARAQRPARLGWRELHAGSLATRRRRWRNHRGGRAAPLTALTPAAPKGASILASRPAPCYAAGCDAQRGAAQHKACSHHRREGLQRRFARAGYSWHMHHLTRHAGRRQSFDSSAAGHPADQLLPPHARQALYMLRNIATEPCFHNDLAKDLHTARQLL